METRTPYADLDSPHSTLASSPGTGTPGKRSMTQGMAPRTVIYRATERDANGVAPDAEAAVARASGGSGAPLPARVQRQFEQSLGTDLSAVRVHTGAESAQAASAVGARAYTVGNDIHFAEGRYQPDDPFGLHLLAHEVAHTAQQAGGAQRRQHKLEVSAPQDAAEHEADRAADAMVRGEAAVVSGGGGLARKIYRDSEPHKPEAWEGQDPYPDYSGIREPGAEATMGAPDVKPDPNDPYNQGAVNWDSMAPAVDGPEKPPGSISISMQDRGPMPVKPTDPAERRRGVSRETFQRRYDTWEALRAAVTQVTSSWGASAPNIGAYHDAANQFDDGGILGPSPTGENWKQGTGQTYGEQAMQQTGPGADNKTTVRDVFTKKATLGICKKDGTNESFERESNTVQGISDKSKDAARTLEVSKALEQARVEDGHVQTASTKYRDHIDNVIRARAVNVDSALQALTINEQSVEKDEATQLEKDLTGQKAAAAKEMKDVIGVVSSVLGALTTAGAAAASTSLPTAPTCSTDTTTCANLAPPPAPGAPEAPMKMNPMVSGGIKGAAEYLADRIAGLEFDDRIKAAHKRAEAAAQKIKIASSKLANNDVTSKLAELASAVSALGEHLNNVKEALKKRRDAYDNAAKIAAAQVKASTDDPAQADRIATAIAAIPKVQLVLSRVNMALAGISPPGYTEPSGVAFAVAQKRGGLATGEFLARLGQLKGYEGHFTHEAAVWERRLVSLRKLTGGMNVAGT